MLQLFGTVCKKATVHQVTTVLATSENVPFPGHNFTLIITLAGAQQWQVISTGG